MDEPYVGFADVYDRLMSDVDYDMWASYLLERMRRCGVVSGGSAVDCACGTGAFSLRFAEHGYRMTGVDRSEQMLGIAQTKARKAGLNIPFVRQDIRSFCVHKPVDAVNCACDGVNYLLSMEDVTAFFTSAHTALKPGGILLFDVSSDFKLAHVLGGHTFGEDGAECTYLWQNTFDAKTKLLEMNLVFFRPDKSGMYIRFDETHIQRAHSQTELTDALKKAGFGEVTVFGAFTTRPPEASDERIQFIARKEPENTGHGEI
jgi:ubiquinone/menaquinone biosynthesis C-methylase UbiE